jgi:8-oxo-dGTP pyrophosphatase MutT (NUDIX family)
MTLRLHERLRQTAFLAYSRLTRGMTLGVRAMLLKESSVILVRHTYVSGWYFPGGGVDPGEAVGGALEREIAEEAGAALTGPAELFGLYRNSHADARDHVALFVCRDWEQPRAPILPTREIAALDLFPVDALPEGTSRGTISRLEEVLRGAPRSTDW